MTIGNNSYGTFRIDGGSVYGGGSPSFSTVIIGSQQGSLGLVTVTDLGSQWLWGATSGTLSVGGSGSGRLDILNGAAVVTGSSSSSVNIASGSAGQGTINVQGAGSTLYTSGLTLGQSSNSGGSALLQIGTGAIVNAATNFGNGGTTIWSGGRVELNGGLLRTYTLTQNGTVIGSGEVSFQSTGTFTNSGRLEADANQLLRFTGSPSTVTNTGAIIADGGEIEIQRALTNSTNQTNAGEISLRNGRLRAGTTLTSGVQLTNSGNLASIGGESDVYGRVTNTSTGNIAATNNSVLRFHDDVTADGGSITVFPGSSAVFLEDLTMNAGSKLLANLAGTNQNTGFGNVEVVGVAQLAGNVQATLAAGFTPHAGDTFPLVAASSISGALGLGDMPALPAGLKWDLDTEANHVVLNVVPGLAGDYNGNGVVDSADFVVWRKTLDQTGANLAADGNSNGRVDATDYDFWRSRLGNPQGSGLATAAAVPEPASITLVFAGLALVVYRRRKLQ